MICYLFDAPKYFFFAADLPQLLYYSHIPAAIIALMVGLFVFLNAPKNLLNRLLFFISLSFSSWVLVSLMSWTNIQSDSLLFAWTFFGVFSSLISIFSIYFIYVFLNKGKDIPTKLKLTFLTLLAPVLLLAQTNLSLSGFNLIDCDAFAYEGLQFKAYTNILGVLAMVWIFILLIKGFKKADTNFKKQIIFMGVGIEFFLFLFFSITFLASYLTGVGVLEDSRYEFFGLFGMIIFMVTIGFLIVRFKTFNVGLLASQALIVALLILVGAQITYLNSTTTSLVLTAIAFLLTAFIGYILIRSVKKEHDLRLQVEKLAGRLERANVRLKELDKLKSEFVSIASHQLRSPLTSIRGYASMLAEGSFGKLPEKAKEPVERIEESSRLMALAVEDYLNVSRIESGNMKYNLADFNLKEEVEKITDDIRPVAMEKGLILLFRTKLDGRGIVNADVGKSVQIIHNLINNSLKYTPKGSISVIVRDDKKSKKVYVDIVDTGIGISKENLTKLFQKFSRADNANSTNVKGTGLGLFVALKMAQAMNGDITVQSEGDGKGSVFTFELPLVM